MKQINPSSVTEVDAVIDILQQNQAQSANDISYIKSQMFKFKSCGNPENRDNEWYGKAFNALKVKGREHQSILIEINRLKRLRTSLRIKSQQQPSKKKVNKDEMRGRVEQCFVDIARDEMPSDIFQRMISDAITMARLKYGEN